MSMGLINKLIYRQRGQLAKLSSSKTVTVKQNIKLSITNFSTAQGSELLLSVQEFVICNNPGKFLRVLFFNNPLADEGNRDSHLKPLVNKIITHILDEGFSQ